MYDYLDGLAEQLITGSIDASARLFQAFSDAVIPSAKPCVYYTARADGDDGGYLAALIATVQRAFALVPAHAAVSPTAHRAARRCAEAQSRVHVPLGHSGSDLRAWATHNAAGSVLGWREFLAGAVTSALSVYALLAAGADHRTTAQQAVAIDSAYLSIGAVATMLDSLIDYQHDLRQGTQWFVRLYENPALLASHLAETAKTAAQQARMLPHHAHHLMTLTGVAAYYLSAPEAHSEFARALTKQLRRELGPMLTPPLAILRAWRTAKRIGGARPGGGSRSCPHPGPH
jgi:tetraprenyl-beta-curcumene synthase